MKTSLNNNTTPDKTGFVYDSRYLAHNPGNTHPESPARLKAILQQLQKNKFFSRSLIHIKPSPADLKWITKIHDKNYVEEVKRNCLAGKKYLHSLDTGISKHSFQVALLAAGGVLKAIDAIMAGQIKNAFCAIRPPGHHALKQKAMGFCLFNNVAIGAQYIREKYNLPKVLIIDFDVHHGNGTQDAFYNIPEVLFFSVHQHPFYPGTGKQNEKGERDGYGYNVNIPLCAGNGDKEYIRAFSDKLKLKALEFKPDFILLSAGFDAHQDDPLGNINVTSSGFEKMTGIIKKISETTCNGRLVSVLEGGYDLIGLAKSVAAHIAVLMDDAK